MLYQSIFNQMNELQNNRNRISTETVVQFEIIVTDIMKNFAIVKENIEEFENRFKVIESTLQKLSEK
jgi:predicted  nucleic acid-binding Zn-ribbon protein